MSVVLTIEGKQYPLPIDDVLEDLTGAESIMLEDYLGGWDGFDIRGGTTRSVVVLVWLAKHHAGETVGLSDVETMKGLVFGNTVEFAEDDADPPAEDPDSSSGTSETNGAQALERSTA